MLIEWDCRKLISLKLAVYVHLVVYYTKSSYRGNLLVKGPGKPQK